MNDVADVGTQLSARRCKTLQTTFRAALQEERMKPLLMEGLEEAGPDPKMWATYQAHTDSLYPCVSLTSLQWHLSACESLPTWISQSAQAHKINPTIILCIFWF